MELMIGSRCTPGADFIDLRKYSHQTFFRRDCPAGKYQRIWLDLSFHKAHLLRPLLRDIDWMLTENGEAFIELPLKGREILYFDIFRICSLRYAISASGNRYGLTKWRSRVDADYDNRSWSICIVSGGNNDARLVRILESVERNRIPGVEVIIVGPRPGFPLPPYVRHVPYEEHPVDPRFPISAKKNLAAQVARYENLLVIHDRFRLDDNWYEAILALRPDWDVLVMPMRVEGAAGHRLTDWHVYGEYQFYPSERKQACAYYRSYPFDYANLIHENIPYDEYHPHLVVNGGAFAVKRSVLLEVPIADLHWAEIEDGDWSLRLIAGGKIISLAPGAILKTLNDRSHIYRGGLTKWTDPIGEVYRHRIHYTLRRLAIHGVVTVLDRLNRNEDLFRKRGLFARRTRTFDSANIGQLKSVEWGDTESVYLRGIFETERNLRPILHELKTWVPFGKSVYFELATTGVGFFRRALPFRNCELLSYEIATVFRDHFFLRQMFATQQNNFILHFERISPPYRYPLARLVVVECGVKDACELEPFLNTLAESWVRSGIADIDAAIVDSDAVFFLREVNSLGNAEEWAEIYRHYGNVYQPLSPENLVLEGNLLISRTNVLLGKGPYLFEDSNAFRQVFEERLIVEGFYPHTLPSRHSTGRKQ